MPVTRIAVAALLAGLTASPAAPSTQDIDLSQLLDRVGQRVTEWYSRAQSIVSNEEVRIQQLRYDLTPTAPLRRLGYELRVAWNPERAEPGQLPEATVVRQLTSVNGGEPRAGDDSGCYDPKSVSPEPLAMLLPDRRDEVRFSVAGRTRVGERDALVVDFQGIERQTPEVVWSGDCVSVDLPGWMRGSIWIDAASYDVLRLDEHLVGQFEFDVPRARQRRGATRSMVIERADSSIRYRRVDFEDPAESLMLPAEVETMTVIRGPGVRRTRIWQRYSGHRRFLGAARVIP